MGWLKIDDGFADSPKVDNLSDGAVRLWVVVGCWLRQPKQADLNGFVPAAALDTITRRRWPAKTLQKLAQELVNATVGGLHKHGLWEPTEGGWLYHDWEQFQPTDDDVLTPAEKGRIGGIKSAEARRAKSGTAIPENAPNRRSTELASAPASANGTEPASAEPASTKNTEAAEAPSSLFPLPDQRSDPEVGSKDLKASARDPEPESAPLPPPPPVQVQPRSESRPPIAAVQRRPPQANDTSDTHSEPRTEIPPSESIVARLPTRRERASDDLMSCPIDELAKRCRLNHHDAAMSNVAGRPEVVRVNEAWCKAVGLTPRKLGAYSERNRQLTTLLEAFEVATEEDLLRVCEQAGRDDWCTGRKGTERDPARKRDVGCLTQTVLSRLLEAAEQHRPKFVNPRVAAMLAAEKQRKAGQL